MKKILLTICCLLTTVLCYAYDFEVDGLYFNILSLADRTVEITASPNNQHTNTYYGSSSNCPIVSDCEELIIPETVSFLNKNFDVVSLGDHAFAGYKNLKKVVIPNCITKIGEAAFNACCNLKAVSLPKNLVSISWYAFAACDNLIGINIPSNVENISNQAFIGCNSLSSFVVEDGEKTLTMGGYVFSDDWGRNPCPIQSVYYGRNITVRGFSPGYSPIRTITTAVVGNNVTNIDYLFMSCASLTDVTLPSNISSIGNYAFYNCSGLTSITIPNSVTSIGECAFYGCNNIKEVNLTENITYINNEAFYGCGSLQSICIPECVKSIKSKVFQGCTNLTLVYSKSTSPCAISDDVFEAMTLLQATLYVPTNTRNIYCSTGGWKDFETIKETDEFGNISATYKLFISATEGGSIIYKGLFISNKTIETEVKEEENVTLSFTPDNGYELKSVEVNGIDVINEVVDNSYTISSVNQNTSIVVTFAELPIFLTIKSADNGSIAQQVEKGKVYSFVITPSEGWNIESVSFNGENVTSQLEDNKYTTPVITSDSELNIVYKLDESSSVKALRSQDNVSVIASNGYVIISDNDRNEKVSVYLIGGAEVATDSGNCNIQLKPGVYIVKVGDEVYKVSI